MCKLAAIPPVILEKTADEKTTVEVEEGGNRVCFRDFACRGGISISGKFGWVESAACWHEVSHLEKALKLARGEGE